MEGVIKQIARNQLCSPCPGLERAVGFLQLQLLGQFPSTCWVPGLRGAEGRIESESQVMPARPSRPPEEGRDLAVSGLQASGLGGMRTALGAQRTESSHLAGVIWEGFLQEAVLEADFEDSAGVAGGNSPPRSSVSSPGPGGTHVAGPWAMLRPSRM